MLQNRFGTPVDPVPFLVVSVLGFAVSFSVGPIYAMEFGASLSTALVVAALTTAAVAAVAYHRYIWTERPELRGEVPAEQRFQRLIYGMLAGFLCVALLALPILAG